MGSLELVTSSSRKSFDSAYANLETTVRNFSRDKMAYEDAIKKLKSDLEGRDNKLKENGVTIETLISENDNLISLHDEDAAARASVDALMYTVSMKQELFSKTVDDFESLEREIMERYETAEDFIESVKVRHEKLTEKLSCVEQDLLKERVFSKDIQGRLQASMAQLNQERQVSQAVQETLHGVSQELHLERNLTAELNKNMTCMRQQLELEQQNSKELGDKLNVVQNQLELECQMTKEMGEKLTSVQNELEHKSQVMKELDEKLTNVQDKLEQEQKIVKEKDEKLSETQTQLEQERQIIKEKDEKLSEVQTQLEQEKQIINEIGQNLTDVRKKLQLECQKTNELEEHLKDAQGQLEQEKQITKEMSEKLEGAHSDLEQERRTTKELQEVVVGAKQQLEEKERINQENENKLSCLQQTLQKEVSNAKESEVLHQDVCADLKSQIDKKTEELAEQSSRISDLEEKSAVLTHKYEEAVSSIKELESLRKSESEQYTVEIHEQIEMVETFRVERDDLSTRLDSLLEEKNHLELSFIEELAKKDEIINSNGVAINIYVNQIESLKKELIKSEAEHKKKMEGLKNYLDSEKSSSATPRRSSVQLPSTLRKLTGTPTAPATPTTHRSILKRPCSRDQSFNRNVHFNYNVEVHKFNPVFTVSSSDSEDSQATEIVKKPDPPASAPPAKKAKCLAEGDGVGSPSIPSALVPVGKVAEKLSDAEPVKDVTYDENEITAPSPKKFFRNRTGQSPTKSPSNCKGPRISSKDKSFHHSHSHKSPAKKCKSGKVVD